MPDMTARRAITGIVCTAMLAGLAVSQDVLADRVAIQATQPEPDDELQTLLADAEDLLAVNRAAAAFELLANKEAVHAGNPLFDYLLGVAALDTGRGGEAIFSLQRALAVEPGFSGARLELARAWFETGYPARARPLFVQTLDEQPPPALREVIVRYLLAIDAAAMAPQSRLAVYAELFAGHDSNANGSTADEQFLGFVLNNNNVRKASVFIDAGAGFDWQGPRDERFGWYLAGRAAHRRNPDAGFVDASTVNGDAGFSWRRGRYFGRAGLNGYYGARDGETNESFGGVEAVFGRRLSESWDLSLSVQGGAQRYDAALDVLEVNRLLYALSAARRFANGVRLSIAAVGGNDSERQAGSPYGNSKAGARAGIAVPLGPAAHLAASIGSLRSNFDGVFFGSAREDRQLSAKLELEFRDVWINGLSVSPRVRYIDNDSDIPLYRYDRSEIGVGLKWVRQ